jgi:hypothetical protein
MGCSLDSSVMSAEAKEPPPEEIAGAAGPDRARQVFDELEAKVEPAGSAAQGDNPGGEDYVRDVPGSGEPPD